LLKGIPFSEPSRQVGVSNSALSKIISQRRSNST
jgi:hypothetical protein